MTRWGWKAGRPVFTCSFLALRRVRITLGLQKSLGVPFGPGLYYICANFFDTLCPPSLWFKRYREVFFSFSA
jgi:hypothetical protein